MTDLRNQDSEETHERFIRSKLSAGRWTTTKLSILALLVVLLGTAFAFGVSNENLFMPGNISLKHAFFADDCVHCHVPWHPSWMGASDERCVTCHQANTHYNDRSRVSAPQCASCHTEHQGRPTLVTVPDAKCVQCHGALQVRNGHPIVDGEITAFTDGHPEFAVFVQAQGQPQPHRVRLDDSASLEDTAVLQFNHQRHMNPQLLGPDGPEPLRCTTCHRIDLQGAYMRPVTYGQDCRRCHTLDFDDRLPGKVVPHGVQPEEVHRYLRAAYAEYYLDAHETELRGRKAIKRLPGRAKSKADVWVDEMVQNTERYLFAKPVSEGRKGKCLLCHGLQFQDQESPAVMKTGVPERWFPYSTFRHAPHLSLSKKQLCLVCHKDATASEVTADVLLPRMESCRSCHARARGVRTQCITCHRYHGGTGLRREET